VGEAGEVIIQNACNLKTTLTPIVENATDTVVTGAITTKELAEKNPGWTLTGVVVTLAVIAAALSAPTKKTPEEMGGVLAHKWGGQKNPKRQ
jgi:hypothetical protein